MCATRTWFVIIIAVYPFVLYFLGGRVAAGRRYIFSPPQTCWKACPVTFNGPRTGSFRRRIHDRTTKNYLMSTAAAVRLATKTTNKTSKQHNNNNDNNNNNNNNNNDKHSYNNNLDITHADPQARVHMRVGS